MEEDEDRKPQIFEQLESDPASIEKLHKDLWGVIFCRLPVVDYVRSGAVCRSWRRATAHCRSTKTPWLMFPDAEDGSDDPENFRFFDIADLTCHWLRLPRLRGNRIDGSSHSSIIASGPTEILLLDPLTAAEVRLPPLITRFYDDLEAVDNPFITEKLVFSPSTSTAAVIYVEDDDDEDYYRHYLSFARVGDTSWTWVHESCVFHYYYFFDLIIHRGKFYMLGPKGSLQSFNPAASENVEICHHGYSATSFDDYDRMYLVESLDGDRLLLVCRMMDNVSWMTNSFDVFRQDEIGHRWVVVGSLGELAIFLGSNYSTCIFTRGLPELRGNCIYFTEDRSLRQDKDDFGVFSLEDRSIEQFVSLQHIRPSRPPPFWVMPS